MKRGLVLRAQCPHSSGSEGGPQSPSLGSMGPSAAAPHGTSIVLQEMQLVAQLEEQLQAETKEIKVVCRGEGIGTACPLVGTWRAPSRPSPHLTRVSLGTGLPAALGLCCCAAGLPLSCTSPGCAAGPDQHPYPVFTYRRRLSGRGDVGSPSG